MGSTDTIYFTLARSNFGNQVHHIWWPPPHAGAKMTKRFSTSFVGSRPSFPKNSRWQLSSCSHLVRVECVGLQVKETLIWYFLGFAQLVWICDSSWVYVKGCHMYERLIFERRTSMMARCCSLFLGDPFRENLFGSCVLFGFTLNMFDESSFDVALLFYLNKQGP